MDVRLAATLLLLLAALVNSCVSPSRKPAQAAEEEICEDGFRKVFPLDEVGDLPAELGRRQKMISLIRSQVHAKMKVRSAPQSATCEREVLLQDLKVDLGLRIEGLERLLAMGQSLQINFFPMLSGPLFSDPKVFEASLCYADCMDRVRLYEKRNECAVSCGMKSADEGEGRDITQMAGMFFSCRDDQGKIDHERVKRNLEEYLVSPARLLLANQEALAAGNSATEKLLKELRQQLKTVTKFIEKHEKPKMACTRPQPQLKLNLSQAVVGLQMRVGTATGFVVNAKDGPRLVTAAHVYDKSRLKNLTSLNGSVLPAYAVGKGGQPKYTSTSFVVAPGMQDFSNDISTTAYTEGSEAFDVIESGKVPDPKAVYYIAGFPVSERGFQIYPCEFKGILFGTKEDPTPVYSLECHDVKGHIQGMSGGPLFDQEGKVWGVISYERVLINRIGVRPLSRDGHGKLILGFKEAFSTPYCEADDRDGFRTCQIVPGVSELGP